MSATSVTFDILARDRASQAFKNVGQASDGLHSKFSKLGGAATTLAKGALIGGVGAAVTGLAVVFKTGINEVSDYQRGFAQLTQGLKTTHGVAGITAKQMEALAASIQGYSGQTDDSIVATEQMLLTFTNVRNEAGKNNDVFTQTTKIAADMAARFGGDASTQAVRLGKALNDPVKGLTALTRVGVAFTEGQKKQIKSLVAHGHTLGAQKIILHELNKEFGGSAKAVGNTLPGMIDKAKRHFEDWSQSLVTKMLPALTNLAHFIGDKVIPFVEKLATQGFAKLLPAIATVSAVLSQHLVPAFEAVAGFVQANILPILQAVAEFVINKLYPALGKILGGALDGLRMAFQHISATVAAHREQLQTLGVFLRKVAEIALKVLTPVLKVGLKTAFRILGTAISLTITIIADAVSVIRGIINAGAAVVGWVRSHWKAITVLLAGPFALAVAAVSRHIGDILGFVKSVPGKVRDFFSDAGSWLVEAGKAILAGLLSGLLQKWEDVKGFVGGIGGWIKGHKGPLEVDRKLLVPAGHAIMDGLVQGLQDRMGALTSKLATITGNIRSMASGMGSSLTGQFDLSNAPSVSVGGVTGFLSAGLGAARRFNSLIRRLIGRHVSSAVIQQIIGMGIGPGTALASNLVGASDRQLNRIDRLYGGITRVDNATGRLAAEQQSSKQLEKVVGELQKLRREVAHLKDEARGAAHKASARS